MGICGKIYEDENGELCACEMETPKIEKWEVDMRMTMVAPFPTRHLGAHKGEPIKYIPQEAN